MNKEYIQLAQVSKMLESTGKNNIIPKKGWLYTIRTTLGMTTSTAAKRAGISTTAWKNAENREVLGTITIATLTKFLNALSCNFIYSPFPKEKLENIIKKQILEYVKREIISTESTMSLENQSNSKIFSESIIKKQAEDIFRKGNWKEIWQ